MSLKPWREVAIPHEDVLKGTFQQAEFAADISRVHDGTATAEYQDPSLFFKRTFITEGMRLLLNSVVKRLSGKGGDPVIQLQTAFGGGKTHTMLAVYHLAKGNVSARELQGVAPIIDAAGVKDIPKAKIAVLDGVKLSPNQPKERGSILVNTMWGALAWQLGGDQGYEMVKNADISGTSPGKEVLAKLISTYAPCVILIDELVAYIRQFEDGKTVTGGTFDSNLSFLQALTESLKAVPNAVLLASLPESDKEAGSQRGINALRALEHYFARVQAIWKPVATEEAFEIVRRRLFTGINDSAVVKAVCREYADYYVANGTEFPQETQESRYYDRLVNAYPIHPEVFDRLYGDWSTLDNFQRTRGVLKFMAKVIHRLWSDGNKDYLIQPANIPLYDADVRNEVIYYLPQGWDPVLEDDIDGERAETTSIEKFDTRFGSVQACRRVARTIFLGSAPSNSDQRVRGLDPMHVMLGCVQPGQQVGLYRDALKRLTDSLHYLNSTNDRFWFDTRTNLRREMEERKRRYADKEKEEVFPVIRNILQRALGQGIFGGVHVFTLSGDIPDDWALRLAVLPPDVPFGKALQTAAIEKASEILRNRGDQPRQKQNRLIFLAADNDSVRRLKDQVKTMLAWHSIVEDVRDFKLNIDQLQTRQASKYLEDASEGIRRMIRESYKWVLTPMQEDRNGKGLSEVQWEHFPVNPSAANLSSEIERVLRENELLISEWAPVHLATLVKRWFWKADVKEIGAMDVWQKTCCYLYLPRLKDDGVFRNALIAGSANKDFFGFAYGKEGNKYVGFAFGTGMSPILDASLLLIEPNVAGKYTVEYEKPQETMRPTGDIAEPSKGLEGTKGAGQTTQGRTSVMKNHFYGAVEVDPVRAKLEFVRIAEEIIQHFNLKPDARIKISVEVQAESTNGFDETIQRVIKENCNVLRFKNAEFEKQ